MCFHDLDPSWFQGYFLPKNSTKPWGLLAVQEEVESCSACTDGGYRQVTLTVFPRGRKTKKRYLKHVEWTGGDMMRLEMSNGEHNNSFLMETERMMTGPRAIPYVQRYFSRIVEQARTHADDTSSVLKLLPNIAIVTGPMSITLPKVDDDEDM